MPVTAPLFADLADAPAGGTAHWVTTTDDKRIRLAVWSGGSRATVLLFPGRTEYIEKYGRVVAELVSRGFSVVVHDWRGQGLSTRPNGTTDLGHVDDFSDYQRDIQAVLSHPAVTGLPKRRVLLCHSMGGCIGLRALHEGLDVQAAIFTAPMWGIGLNAFMNPVARTICAAGCTMGQKRRHAPGMKPDFYIQRQDFDGNTLTNDPDTYAWLRSHLDQKPELGLGGPSMGWLNRAFAETDALARMPVPMPVLTFLGTNETVVDPVAIRAQMGKDDAGKLVISAGAQHEILMETGDVRERAWFDIDSWLKHARV